MRIVGADRALGSVLLASSLFVVSGAIPPEPMRTPLQVAPPLADTSTRIIGVTGLRSLDSLPADWKHLELGGSGPTRYHPVSSGSEPCLRAVSRDQASALVRMLDADPRELSRLQWRWRVEEHVNGADLSRKEGDDFAARVYVNFAFDPDRASLFDRVGHRLAEARYGAELPGSALNYVWANEEPVGTHAPNAYTDRTRMVVLRNREHAGEGWFDEARDIFEDYRVAFGVEPPAITGIGIMTDTDDTGGRAEACYGDLRLSAGGR